MTVSVGVCTAGTTDEGVKCHTNCDSTQLTNPIDDPTVCSAGTEGSCLICQDDSRYLDTGVCYDCHEWCLTCTDATACAEPSDCHWTCDGTPDKTSMDSVCTGELISDCSDCLIPMTYMDSGTTTCVACGEFCVDCASDGTCTTWAEGHYDSLNSKTYHSLFTNPIRSWTGCCYDDIVLGLHFLCCW